MIEALLLLAQLVLFGLLLLGVRRISNQPGRSDLGVFAYDEVAAPEPPATKKG
jgi:hypothetical protein